MARCPRCGGDGMDPEPAAEPDPRTGEPIPVPQRCKACGGDGTVPDEQLELR